MASIRKRPDGKWRARYRDPSNREHAKHFATRRDAQLWLNARTAELARGVYVDPAAGRRLFGDYAAAWLEAQVMRPTTRERLEVNLNRHILPVFGARPIASIRPTDVQSWVRGLAEQLAASTVTVAYQHFAGILRAAVDDGLLVQSPCRRITLPRVERPVVAPLALEQVHALADAAPDHVRALVLVAAGTGMRQGELLGLTVDRVDFLRRTVTVDRQLQTVTGHAPYLAPPKSSAARRTIPVPQLVVDELAVHLARFPAGGELELVFAARDGSPWRRNRFGETWRRLVARAELPDGTRLHDLRHFYASALIRGGESVKTVQARLGHTSATVTLDVYGHLWPDGDDRTREAIERALGGAADRVALAD